MRKKLLVLVSLMILSSIIISVAGQITKDSGSSTSQIIQKNIEYVLKQSEIGITLFAGEPLQVQQSQRFGFIGQTGINFDLVITPDPKQEVNITIEEINETTFEIVLDNHPNSTTRGNYRWNMALCNVSDISTLYYMNEDAQGGFNFSTTINITHSNLINFGMNETWCQEQGGMGYPIFSSGSKNQLPKTIRIILPDNLTTSASLKIYAGTGSVLIDANAVSTTILPSGSDNLIRLKNGTLIAAYEGSNDDPFCAVSHDNGATWDTFQIVASTVLDVAVTNAPNDDNENNVMFYWRTAGGVGDIDGRNSSDACSSFTGTFTIADTEGGLRFPSCVYDGGNVVKCVFTTAGGILAYTNSTQFNTETTVVNDAGDQIDRTSIAVNGSGQEYIFGIGVDGDDLDVWSTALNGYGTGNRVQICDGTSFNTVQGSFKCIIKTIYPEDKEYFYCSYVDVNDLQIAYGKVEDISSGTNIQCLELDASSSFNPTIGFRRDNLTQIIYSNATEVSFSNLTRTNSSGNAYEVRTFLQSAGVEAASIRDSNFPAWNQIGELDYLEFVFANASGGIFYRNYSIKPLPRPEVNGTINNSAPEEGDVINISANATSFYGLRFAQIITNQSGFNEIINYSSIDKQTIANVSQNFTIACNDCVINFTVRVNNTLGKFQYNQTIVSIPGVIEDTTAPIINGSINDSSVTQNEHINASFNATDNSLNVTNGTIIINNTGFNRFFNFSFNTSGQQEFSQNFTISEATGSVINITAIATDNSSNTARNQTIFTVVAVNNIPQILLIAPTNNTDFTFNTSINGSNVSVILNISVTDADNDNIDVLVFGANSTAQLEDGNHSLLFITKDQSGTSGGFNITYNWSAPVVQLEKDHVVLMHFDNRSEFDETTEGTNNVKDFSIYENNGSITGAIFNLTDGKFGGGFRFSSSAKTDFIEIGTSNWSINNITITAWVKASGFSDINYIFGHTTEPAFANRIQLYIDDVNGNLDFGLGDTHALSTGIKDLEIDRYYHMAITWNTTKFAIYVDGVKEANGTHSALTTLNTIFDIGNNGDTGSRDEAWNGTIDEFAVWNRSLTNEEINDLYRLRNGTWFWKVNTTDKTDTNQNRTFQFNINPTVAVEDTTNPIINGSLNDSSVTQNEDINITFNMTDETALDNLTIIINQTGVDQFFNFSLTGTEIQRSQNFTIACSAGCVINITGKVNDASGNLAQNETILTVASGGDTTPPSFTTNPYNKTTTNESVEISWTTDENANYTLTIGVCPSFTGTNSFSNATLATTHNKWIDDLQNSTNYCVNVTATDSSANSASENVSFTTATNIIQQSANEEEGDNAIQLGINTSEIWIATVYDSYQVGGANLSHQFTGKFDKFAIKGNKRWALNYVSSGESAITGIFNITPTLYVLQLQDLTSEEITDRVGDLINSTYP